MNKYNCYIVNKQKFKIDHDNVDFNCGIKIHYPCTAEDLVNGRTDKSSLYLVGRPSNLYPEGKMYPYNDCFKTIEEAEDKLIEVIRSEIEKNEILMRNLVTENGKLYEKIKKIHDRRHKEANEKAI